MSAATINDIIGFIGVFILLVAFLLNLSGKLHQDSIVYILLNIVGAGLACLASVLISYIPFVILEGTWTLVSIVALFNYYRKRHKSAASYLILLISYFLFLLHSLLIRRRTINRWHSDTE